MIICGCVETFNEEHVFEMHQLPEFRPVLHTEYRYSKQIVMLFHYTHRLTRVISHNAFNRPLRLAAPFVRV